MRFFNISNHQQGLYDQTQYFSIVNTGPFFKNTTMQTVRSYSNCSKSMNSNAKPDRFLLKCGRSVDIINKFRKAVDDRTRDMDMDLEIGSDGEFNDIVELFFWGMVP